MMSVSLFHSIVDGDIVVAMLLFSLSVFFLSSRYDLRSQLQMEFLYFNLLALYTPTRPKAKHQQQRPTESALSVVYARIYRRFQLLFGCCRSRNKLFFILNIG